MRKLRTDFGRREAPSAPYVRYLVKKKRKKLAALSINQSVKRQKRCVHPGILLLWQNVRVKRHSQILNILEISLRRFLRKDLGMTPHKVQLLQGFEDNRLTEDADFSKKKNHLFR